jgi:hypothetical protein
MDKARRDLAHILFDAFSKLDPGGDNVAEWEELGNWGQSLYINCIDRLLEERELINSALEGSDDDCVSRRSDKGE